MLLRQWLQELGMPGAERSPLALKDIHYFDFGEDRYVIKTQDREFQDNNLERLLSVLRDEFHTHNMTAILKGGERLHPSVEYPFAQGKQFMRVRPVVWTAVVPPPDLDNLIEALERNITFFNLTGQFQQPYCKDNL